uniref:Uncharacterized protein n=1 Tax=Knipowitschia caucasica TaxID=637954 RepID=A0AAV2LQ74_KNICA
MSSDARPSSPSPSGVGRRRCSTCRVRLQRTDQHSSCFMCLGPGHAALSATCTSCLALPREESERRRAYLAAAAPRPDSSQDEESETDWAPLDLPPVPAEWGDCEDGEVSEVGSLLTLDEVVSNPEPDRFPLNHMPGLYSSAAAIMDAPLPPQATQRVEDFTSGYATARGRRRTQPTLCPRMDPIVHYAKRERPKPLAAKRPALGYGMYCSVQDWSWTGGVPDIEDSVRMALHPSASVEAEKRQLLDLPVSQTSLFGPDMQTLVARLETAAKDSASLAQHLAPRREARPPARSRDRGRERSPGRRPDPYPHSVAYRPPSTRPPGPDRPTGGSRDQRTHRRPPYGRGGRGGKNSFNKGRPAFHHYSLSESHLGACSPQSRECSALRELRAPVHWFMLCPPRERSGGGICKTTLEKLCKTTPVCARQRRHTPGLAPPLHEARARGGHSSQVTCDEQSRTYEVGPVGHVTAPGAHGVTQGAPRPFRPPPLPARNTRKGRGRDVSCSSSRSAPHRLLLHLEGARFADRSMAGENIAQGLRTAILPKSHHHSEAYGQYALMYGDH